ncbi:MAG TPA: cupin domain-containing protein [Gaiella sp.]|jgi:quercetin dioxygenase-like cupin family protein
MTSGEKLTVRMEEGRRFDALGVRVTRLIHPLTVGSEQLCVAYCVMQPGDEARRHHHDNEEAFFVLEGEGTMYLEGVGDVRLEPGLAVYAPPNRVHGIRNDGSGELRILTALSPPPVEGEPPKFADA